MLQFIVGRWSRLPAPFSAPACVQARAIVTLTSVSHAHSLTHSPRVLHSPARFAPDHSLWLLIVKDGPSVAHGAGMKIAKVWDTVQKCARNSRGGVAEWRPSERQRRVRGTPTN